MTAKTTYSNTILLRLDEIKQAVNGEINRLDKGLQSINKHINHVDNFLCGQLHTVDLQTSNDKFPHVALGVSINNNFEPSLSESDIQKKICKELFIEKCSHIYIFLESLLKTKTASFSDSNRGKLKKAQADIQRIRLWMLDVTKSNKSEKSESKFL